MSIRSDTIIEQTDERTGLVKQCRDLHPQHADARLKQKEITRNDKTLQRLTSFPPEVGFFCRSGVLSHGSDVLSLKH